MSDQRLELAKRLRGFAEPMGSSAPPVKSAMREVAGHLEADHRWMVEAPFRRSTNCPRCGGNPCECCRPSPRAGDHIGAIDAEVEREVEREKREAAEVLAGGPNPWAHRSAKMKCATCMWFVEKQSGRFAEPGAPVGSELARFGRCRRHAPVVGQGWPAVYGSDWCGEHKLDENKA